MGYEEIEFEPFEWVFRALMLAAVIGACGAAWLFG
jgi:hypothetical protein